METAPQPPDDDTAPDSLLGRAEDFILYLITVIESRLRQLGSAPMSARLARLLTRRALLPAEAALRRAILLIAATLPPPAPLTISHGARRRSAAPCQKRAAPGRPPAFCMTEAHPGARKSPEADDTPEHLMPRITLLTDAALARSAPPSTLPSTQPVKPEDPGARFRRRFDALVMAFENPFREAERWLRRQRRQKPGANPPLAPGIPGARKTLGETRLNLLRELTSAAQATLALNTS